MTRTLRSVGFLLLLTLIAGCERSRIDHVALRAVVGTEPVVLLSAAWCGYCQKMRQDLTAWNVTFRELDVETSSEGESAYRLLHARSIPVLLVNAQVQRGYAQDETRRLLRHAGLLPET
ncbi:MAG: glutaredoxin family protein [Dokdonella sp.]